MTIRAEVAAGASELFHLTGSKAEEIEVLTTVDEVDVEKQRQALDCYLGACNCRIRSVKQTRDTCGIM